MRAGIVDDFLTDKIFFQNEVNFSARQALPQGL